MQDTSTSLPDSRTCERARRSRDARFDGLFFTAVSSTGIYCRPVCPAPAARSRNVRYFASAAAAEAAGYRPCLRCRPELAPTHPAGTHGNAIVAAALRQIADGASLDASVSGLAERLGIGPRQLRRLFMQSVGVAPRQVIATRRLAFARQLLTETTLPVTEVALASGYRSLRRFHAAFARAHGTPPRRLRQRPARGGDAPIALQLAYRPPYAFDALLDFLRVRALPGVESVDAHAYARAFGPAAAPGWFQLDAWPGRGHALRLQVHCPKPERLLDIVSGVRRMFDLDADPAAIAGVFGADPLLGPLVARRPGLRVPGSWDGFEIAVRAVLGQQVSVAAARTFARRIVEQYGVPLAAPALSGITHLFPPPAVLAAADLGAIGLTTARAATVRELAAAVADGRLDFHPGQPLEAFVARCVALRGIGPWTAHYIAMRVLGDPDAFPAADLVLRRAVAAGGAPWSERALLARANAWRPWRAYAVMQLWRASTGLAPSPAPTKRRSA